MEVILKVPEVTVDGYTVESWNCPIDVKYSYVYNMNTGEIVSVTYKSTKITPGLAISEPNPKGGQVCLTSLNYENVSMDIVDDGYSVSCTYSATATLMFNRYPGVPADQIILYRNVSGQATVSPQRF